jgi:hypothetical protein
MFHYFFFLSFFSLEIGDFFPFMFYTNTRDSLLLNELKSNLLRINSVKNLFQSFFFLQFVKKTQFPLFLSFLHRRKTFFCPKGGCFSMKHWNRCEAQWTNENEKIFFVLENSFLLSHGYGVRIWLTLWKARRETNTQPWWEHY